VRRRERAQFGHGRHVAVAKLGKSLPVLGCMLARDVEQVVTDEDTRQVDVGAQPTQLRVNLVVMRIQLVELRVDVLRFPRCGEQGDHGENQQAAEAHGRDRPRAEAHGYLQEWFTLLAYCLSRSGNIP